MHKKAAQLIGRRGVYKMKNGLLAVLSLFLLLVYPGCYLYPEIPGIWTFVVAIMPTVFTNYGM